MEQTHRTLKQFRDDIRKNKIAFPAPAPIFPKECRGDIQWRAAELYLIHGWTCERLGQRYGVTRGRVWILIRSWIDKAQRLGYLQEIPPARALAEVSMVALEHAYLSPSLLRQEPASSKINHRADPPVQNPAIAHL